MGKFKDLTGMTFGRLRVISFDHFNKTGNACWKCVCSCGNECVVASGNLKNGNTSSCGCLVKKGNHLTHGKSNDRVYTLWTNIKQRCFNPRYNGFADYGGRGIAVYEPWIHDFPAFYDYVSQLEHYGEDGYTLDRIDNNGNYEPGNLRWATVKEQARNTRHNILVEYNGEKMTVAEAAEKSGVPAYLLYDRIKRGLTGFPLFLLPTRN